MNKTTPFALDFDISTEGCANAYEAVGLVLADSIMPESAILSVRYMALGRARHHTMLITFASVECAKAFTAAYLGYNLRDTSKWDVYTDEEVGEYVATGQFVEA